MRRLYLWQFRMSLIVTILLVSIFARVSEAEKSLKLDSETVFHFENDDSMLTGKAESDQWTDTVTGIEFVRIPAGGFQMGQTEGERQWLLSMYGEELYRSWFANELPRHEVCVGEFWMGTTEVTNAQYRRWKSHHESGTVEGYSLNEDEQPAVNVSWIEAKEFAAWLGKQHDEKYTFRLPTETEWEYAARAEAFSNHFWGDD